LISDLGVPIASTPDGADWSSLVTLWQLAGQTLLVRLQSLEQYGARSGGPSRDVAAYDAAVDDYIDQIRRAWADARKSLAAPGPTATTESEFVDRLVTDPADPPAVVMFVGFAGRAASHDEVRFYLDAELSSFVDIPAEDVLHTQPLAPVHSPLGGQFVWARRDDQLVRTLEDSAGRVAAGAVHDAGTGPTTWSGAPWASMVPGNGNGGRAASPSDVSPFGDVPDAQATSSFPDDEEEIPLPPGWPQPA
jgi:hypothetical protein